MNPDAYYDRRLAEIHEREHQMELHEAAKEEAIADMVQQLVEGKMVRTDTHRYLDAEDVKDELDADALRSAMVNGQACYPMWLEAARRLCARHVEDYMEWNRA